MFCIDFFIIFCNNRARSFYIFEVIVKKIFLISPVRNVNPETYIVLTMYVLALESQGYKVYWPARDTEQNDPTGGYQICRTNFQAILDADQIHIWYDETSQGSKFDMGGAFMLVEILGWKSKKILLVNHDEVQDCKEKSFFKVMKQIAD